MKLRARVDRSRVTHTVDENGSESLYAEDGGDEVFGDESGVCRNRDLGLRAGAAGLRQPAQLYPLRGFTEVDDSDVRAEKRPVRSGTAACRGDHKLRRGIDRDYEAAELRRRRGERWCGEHRDEKD